MIDFVFVDNIPQEPLGFVHHIGKEIVTIIDVLYPTICSCVRLEQFEIHPDSYPLRINEPILLEWVTNTGQIKKPEKRPNIELLEDYERRS